MTSADQLALRDAAAAGDSAAFETLFVAEIPKLRGVLRRMVGHPDDVDELVQQSLLKAFEGIAGFRVDAAAGTWLCSIGARLAIDHLRSRKRWRERAQVMFASACLEDPALGTQVGAAFAAPDFAFDVNQHIAYCFTCIGRSLEPEQQAALVLRDVLELDNAAAAKALGLSRSVLRHRLADARSAMTQSYEGLCALVNKQGACWQCAGLRDAAGGGGPPPPAHLPWDDRIRRVREATHSENVSAGLHDVFFRHTEVQEETGAGDEAAMTECGRPTRDGEQT